MNYKSRYFTFGIFGLTIFNPRGKTTPVMKPKQTQKKLLEIYDALFEHFGPQHWWPAKTPFEVCLGAILTQNTAWSNVEKAIANLLSADVLDVHALDKIDPDRLAELIRPSGYFNQKAKRLQIFARFLLDHFDGDTKRMFAIGEKELRPVLLDLNGIGPETADSMLCYGGGLPVFVVDGYTRRIFSRLGLVPDDIDYAQTQTFFMKHLPRDVSLYNDYHAQIVSLGAQNCKKSRPVCRGCPISEKCIYFKEMS